MSATAGSKLRLKIRSDPANLADVRHVIENFCTSHGFDRRGCDEIGLCVNEALANIIRHAYDGATDRPIEISADVDRNGLGVGGSGAMSIEIRDWGKGVNPETLPPSPAATDPLKPGGLGMICLRQMMDDVQFVPQPDGMLLKLFRKAR